MKIVGRGRSCRPDPELAVPVSGLLCESPGVHLRVRLWSVTSEKDRYLGGSGRSEDESSQR